LALPILKTSDRIRLVYTGDPSLDPEAAPDRFDWRAATQGDAAKGATIAVIRPVSATEHKQAAIEAAGNGEAFLVALLARGLVALDGDPRPVGEIVETMPAAPRLALARAVDRVSSETADPFGQRSSG